MANSPPCFFPHWKQFQIFNFFSCFPCKLIVCTLKVFLKCLIIKRCTSSLRAGNLCGTSLLMGWVLFYVDFSVILLLVKSALVHHAQTHSSTEIQSQSFLFAVSSVIRQFMKRCKLKLPVNSAACYASNIFLALLSCRFRLIWTRNDIGCVCYYHHA